VRSLLNDSPRLRDYAMNAAVRHEPGRADRGMRLWMRELLSE